MDLRQHARGDHSYEEWLADCSSWWDLTRGLEVADHPDLDWAEWYEEGLTVEEAVECANEAVAGL